MFADGNTVEFYAANHIHGVEVNDGVRLHEIGCEIESAVIVKYVVGGDFSAFGKSRQKRFGRERNENFSLIFAVESFAFAKYGIIPFAVERDVTASCKLRTRIFAERNRADFKRCAKSYCFHSLLLIFYISISYKINFDNTKTQKV